jgi:hypothetical protein
MLRNQCLFRGWWKPLAFRRSKDQVVARRLVIPAKAGIQGIGRAGILDAGSSPA